MFHPVEFVGRGSETQVQVGEIVLLWSKRMSHIYM